MYWRRMGREVASLLGWTLLSTVSAVALGFLLGMVIVTALFGHPLFFYGGLMLGPLAGVIGGPVFGVVYGVTLARRHRADQRRRTVLLSGALGGLIFALVGVGFCAWDASERSHQPTKRPLPAQNGEVVERRDGGSYSGGVIQATPEGGRVIEQHEQASDSGRSDRAVITTAGLTALGGFLFGALFGALFGDRRTDAAIERADN